MSSPPVDVEALFAPIGVATFLSTHWEQRPFYAAAPEASRFDHVLSRANVDALLNLGLRHPDVIVLKNGHAIDKEAYCRTAKSISESFGDVIDPDRLLRLWREGHTLKFDTPERFWPPLRQLCAQLTRTFGFGFETNVYMTPPGSRGLGRHYDDEDVFVLHVSGRKRWRVYDAAVTLPDASWPSEIAPVDRDQPPGADLWLEPGDLLYVPRGVVHEAETTDQHALHITVARRAVTLIDWALVALGQLRSAETLRKSVPVEVMRGVARHHPATADLLAQVRSMLTEDVLSDALRQLRNDVADGAAPDRPGGTVAVDAVLALTAESHVVKPAGAVIVLHDHTARLELRYRGQTHVFPAAARGALTQLLSGAPIRVGDLGGLAPAAQLSLARHLAYAGMIEAVP